MAPTDDDIYEEQKQFAAVINTFRNYGKYSLAANNRRRKDLFTLPLADQQLLEDIGYKTRLAEVDAAIKENAQFLGEIVAQPVVFGNEDEEDEDEDGGDAEPSASSHPHDHSHDHSHEQHGGHDHGHSHDHGPVHDHGDGHFHGGHGGHGGHGSHGSHEKPRRPTDFDMDKLRSTLKQFVRDWSEEGKAEREASYKPLKDALLAHFANVPESGRPHLRVLVPGSGLGRLAFDVAQLGFASQGNEFSHYMLLASFFVLNKTDELNKYTFYPYVHSFSNISQKSDLLRPISIPDVLPSALPENANFSLVAGDFEEVYGAVGDEEDEDEPQAGQFDAILTCFFIDTSKNIVSYLRTIYNKLSPGGVWINLGPLLWHWENNNSNDPSVELDLEQVKDLARKIGFEISNERTVDTTYTNNSQGMLGYVYKAALWTATKKE